MAQFPEEELRRYVRDFLKDFKDLTYARRLRIKNRPENKEALIELGLTDKQREEVILSLSIEDFCSGPHEDEINPGNYWVFGQRIDAMEVYIKLKIVTAPGSEYALCLSFHKAKHPLNYPFSK